MTRQTDQAAFAQYLLSGTLVHEATFEQMRQALRIGITPNQAIVVSIDRYPELAKDKPIEWKIEVGQALLNAIKQAVNGEFLSVWIEEGLLAVLLECPPEQDGQPGAGRRLLALVHAIQSLVDREPFTVSVGIGSRYNDPYFMRRSYEEAKESMLDRFFRGNRVVYQYATEKHRLNEHRKPITPDEKMELLARVRIGDEEGSVNSLKVMLERAAESYRYHVDMFKSEALDLLMSLSRMALDLGGDASVILSENAKVVQTLIGTIRYDNFVRILCDYWREMAYEIGKSGEAGTSVLVRAAIKYMKENLEHKLTLQVIAEYCHVNPYYLAHLFKRETAMSCIDFLNKVRIEKALFLLERSGMTIHEIAAHVGFQDANYFSRKFKKAMNCTPTEYRTARLC